MKVLGIRCSHNFYAFVILSGSKEHPIIETENYIPFPKHTKQHFRTRELKWFFLEIQDILKRNKVNSIAIKGAEWRSTINLALFLRYENEAIIFLAAAERGINYVERKTKRSIAKDLCGKGKAKYLKALDYSIIPDFDKKDEKIRDAICVAWSCLK